MAKAKAKKNTKQNSNLAMYRIYAQNLTVGASIAYGMFWTAVNILDNESANTDKIANVLILIIVFGGMMMGLLYALKAIKD